MNDIKTKKFTENILSVRWLVPLERGTITAWNVLVTMLSSRTQAWPSRQEAAQALSHAYGAKCGYGISGYGNSIQVEFRLSWLRSDLMDEEGFEQEVVTIYDQFLHHPVLNEQALEEARYLLTNRLQSLAQDPDHRALQEALQAAGQGHVLSVPMQGVLEDLETITLEDVQALYDLLEQSAHQTFLVGNVHESLRKRCALDHPGQRVETTWEKIEVEQPRSIEVEKVLSQSSYVQVYATDILPQDEAYAALVVFNALLGSSSVNLLFEEIREKRSFCYSVSSFLIRFDGALVIMTAADRENLPEIKVQIKRVIESIVEQSYDPKVLAMTIGELCDTLAGQKDSPMGMLEQVWINQILGRNMSADAWVEKIRQVTPDQVSDVARRLRLASQASLLQKEGTGEEDGNE